MRIFARLADCQTFSVDLPNVSRAVWKTSSIASVSAVTPFDQGLHEGLQMRGGNGPCRCINGIWAHFGIFVDRFGYSPRCLRVHQEPLRRSCFKLEWEFEHNEASRDPRHRDNPSRPNQREGHLLPEFPVLRPRLPRLRLPRPRRRPARNQYLARSSRIKSRPASRQQGPQISSTRRRPIFCNRRSERCPASLWAARLATSFRLISIIAASLLRRLLARCKGWPFTRMEFVSTRSSATSNMGSLIILRSSASRFEVLSETMSRQSTP